MITISYEDRGAPRLLSRLIWKTAANISQCVGETPKRLQLRSEMIKCDDTLQLLCDSLWDIEAPDDVINIFNSSHGPISLVFTTLESINTIIEQDSDLVQNGRHWLFSSLFVDFVVKFIHEQTDHLDLVAESEYDSFSHRFDTTSDRSNGNLETIINMLRSEFPQVPLCFERGKARFVTAHASAQLSFWNMNEDGKEGDHYEPRAIGEIGSEPLQHPIPQPNLPQPLPFYSIINRWTGAKRRGISGELFPSPGHGPRQALLGFLAQDGLDIDKCVMIGLCRDLMRWVVEESLAGRPASEAQKNRLGQRMCWTIANDLGLFNPKAAQRMLALWLDCENGLSKEGRFMNQLDSMDMDLRGDGTTGGDLGLRGLATNVALTEQEIIKQMIIPPLCQELNARTSRKNSFLPVIFVVGDGLVECRPHTLERLWPLMFAVEDGDELCQSPVPPSLLHQQEFIDDSTSRGFPLPPWLAVDFLWSKLEERLKSPTWTLVQNFPKCMTQVEYYEEKVQRMCYSIVIKQPPRQPEVPQQGPSAEVIEHLRANSVICKEIEFDAYFEQQMKQAVLEIMFVGGYINFKR